MVLDDQLFGAYAYGILMLGVALRARNYAKIKLENYSRCALKSNYGFI